MNEKKKKKQQQFQRSYSFIINIDDRRSLELSDAIEVSINRGCEVKFSVTTEKDDRRSSRDVARAIVDASARVDEGVFSLDPLETTHRFSCSFGRNSIVLLYDLILLSNDSFLEVSGTSGRALAARGAS